MLPARRIRDHPPQKEYQTIRAQQRRQILEDVENRELTFKPLINRNAKELAMRRKFRMAAAEAQGVAKAPIGMFESPDKRKVVKGVLALGCWAMECVECVSV